MGATEITLNDALNFLNPEDDSNWTADGLPRMDVIEKLMDDKAITRKDVTDADPEFCREAAVQRREAKAIAESEAELANEENQNDQDPQVQAQEGRQGQIDPEEALKDDIATLSEEIQTLSEERAEIDKAIDLLKKHQVVLQHKSFSQHSATADMKARMEFVKSQTKARTKRHEKGRKILAIIGKDGLNPKCKLDQAMTRKTARGARRPAPKTPNQ